MNSALLAHTFAAMDRIMAVHKFPSCEDCGCRASDVKDRAEYGRDRFLCDNCAEDQWYAQQERLMEEC